MAVSKDATSGLYCPASSAEWTTLLAGTGIPNPTSLHLLQEASGTLADTIGARPLDTIAGGTYQQAVAGWTRTAFTLSGIGAKTAKCATTDAVGDFTEFAYAIIQGNGSTNNACFGPAGGISAGAAITTNFAEVNNGLGSGAVNVNDGAVHRFFLSYKHSTTTTIGQFESDSVNDSSTTSTLTNPTLGKGSASALTNSFLYHAVWVGTALTSAQMTTLSALLVTGPPLGTAPARPFSPPYIKPGQFAKTKWNGPRGVVAQPILLSTLIDPEIAVQSNPTPGAIIRPFSPPWVRPGQFARTQWNGPREVVLLATLSVTATLDPELPSGVNAPAIPGARVTPFAPPWQKPGQFAKTQWNGPREVVLSASLAVTATIDLEIRGYNPARLKAGWWGPWFPKRGRRSWWDGWFPETKGNLILASGGPVVDPSTGAGAATIALVVESGLKVKYSWITDVIKSQHGNETRHSRLSRPQEHYAGTALVVGEDVRTLRATLARFAPLGSAFLLGLAHEGATLTAASSGLVVTVGSTQYLDWAVPGVRCVCIGSDRTQRVECVVQAITATTITLDVAPGTAGTAGGMLMPAVPVYLDPQATFDRYTLAEPVETWQIGARAAQFGFIRSSVAATLALSTVSTSGVLAGLTMVSLVAGSIATTVQMQAATLGVGINLQASENLVSRSVLIQFRAGVATVQNLVDLVAGLNLVRMEGTYSNTVTITRTAATGGGWNAGASSVQTLAGNGFVEFTLHVAAGLSGFVGFSTSDPDQGYTSIGWALEYGASGNLGVWESGTLIGGGYAFTEGDVCRITRTGTTITYQKNGTTIYTSLVTTSAPLLIDTSFIYQNDSVTNIRLNSAGSDVLLAWQNAVGVSVSATRTLSLTADEFGPTTMTGGSDGGVAPVGIGSNVTYYQGSPLYDRGLISTGTNSDSIQMLTEIVDFGGVPTVTSDSDQADWGRHMAVRGSKAADFQWLKYFLSLVGGRQHAFWLPTYRCDLVVVSNTSTTITITSANFISWYQSPFFRTQVTVIQTDGTLTPAQMTTVVDNGNGTFTLTIPITSFLSGVPIRALSWLELVRLETDDVEVTFDGATFAADLQARVVQA